MYPDHPVAGPDRKGRPHLARTWVLFALLGAAVITALLSVSYLIGPAKVQVTPDCRAASCPIPEPTWLFETPAVKR